MNEQEVLQILGKVGAVIKDSHIVYTSGKHGTAYVNKDAVYPHTKVISDLCRVIAKEFVNNGVQVVVAPAIGGVSLEQWTAYHLSDITGREVLGVYAEKNERSVFKSDTVIVHNVSIGYQTPGDIQSFNLETGEEVVVRDGNFVFKRGYDKLVAGKNVLVVEDVLTTGNSVRKVIEATRDLGGNVVGLGVLCNRGGITPQDVGDVPKLFALVNVKLDAWNEKECLLCAQNVPINTDVDKGKEFLARKKTS